MKESIGLVIFLFGSIIGSFLNVVAARYNTGKGILGRSGCMTCGKILSAIELVPLVSFLAQKGRCRGCKSKISFQYPIVELVTGLLFFLVFLKFYPWAQIISPIVVPFWFIIISVLIVIAVYDLKHQIIPDGLVYLFIVLSVVYFLSSHPLFYITSYPGVLDLLAGPILFGVFALLWFVSNERWIGFGDAKLVLGIGFALGFAQGLSAVAIGFWSGAVVSLVLIALHKLKLFNKRFTLKTEIPFAPFLIFGFIVAFLLSADVFNLRFFLSL